MHLVKIEVMIKLSEAGWDVSGGAKASVDIENALATSPETVFQLVENAIMAVAADASLATKLSAAAQLAGLKIPRPEDPNKN